MRSERAAEPWPLREAECRSRWSLGFEPSSTRTPAAHQDGNFEFHSSCTAAIGFGKDNHFDRTLHIFQRALGVEVALLGLEQPAGWLMMPAAIMFSSFPVEFLMPPKLGGAEGVQSGPTCRRYFPAGAR